MSGRTILVGQVWEHWTGRARIRIDGIDAMTVRCRHITRTDEREAPNLHLAIETVQRDYFYVAELER